MKQRDLSIIIVSYNTLEITKQCLDSILKSTRDSDISLEIVVVDNDSHDGSVAMLLDYNKKHDSLFTLLLNDTNCGFGRANNQAIAKASGEFVLMLNSDTVITGHAIQSLLTHARQNPSHHFIGAKLLNADLTPQDSCGPLYTLPVVFTHLLLMGDRWPVFRFTRTSPGKTVRVGWVSGACILCRKSDFERVGGFDEQIFMYMEEIDLLHRAQKLGMNTYFYHSARIIHLGSASSGGQRTFPILQVYNGLLYYYKKHFNKTSLLLLKSMLQLKAVLGIVVGRATGSTYLSQTYEKALAIAQDH
jgi:GT2 family glycosyltransferase